MYFTDNGFVISGRDILIIAVAISTGLLVLQVIGKKIRNITSRENKFEDYPGSTKISDISDVYRENNLDIERRKDVIFEEKISGIPFRYDEKTRVLTIGERFDSNTHPIEVKLNSFDDLKEFVERLEDYVNE